MKLCSEYPCPNEAKYRIGGFEDYDTYCLEHWAIEQKDAVTALREQIAREIEAKCVENHHQGNDDGMGALTSDPSVIYYPETFRVWPRVSTTLG